jgi:hypothetical protein
LVERPKFFRCLTSKAERELGDRLPVTFGVEVDDPGSPVHDPVDELLGFKALEASPDGLLAGLDLLRQGRIGGLTLGSIPGEKA